MGSTYSSPIEDNPYVSFAYRLGLVSGRLKVEGEGGLLQELTWLDLHRWFEFFRMEPFGDIREDMRMHTLIASISALAGNKRALESVPDFYKTGSRRKSRSSTVVHKGIARDVSTVDPKAWEETKKARIRALNRSKKHG